MHGLLKLVHSQPEMSFLDMNLPFSFDGVYTKGEARVSFQPSALDPT